MSWHFLQGQEAASWGGNSLDGAPSALLNLIPSPALSCSRASVTDALTGSQYGTMSEHSMGTLGEAALTSLAAGFHAKTLACPENTLESLENDPGSGNTWRESSVKFDRVSCGWKTHLCLWEEDLKPSQVTFPRWGMMRDGVLWERDTPAHIIKGTEFGSWPTPRSRDWKDCGSVPPSREFDPGKDTLGQRMAKFHPGGKLNPNWVEWLMGWPIGWTDCDASATDKFRQWLNSHGIHFQTNTQ